MRHRIDSLAVRVASLAVFLLPAAARAGNNAAVARVGDDIRYLASDELEGRGPGTKGLEKAAEYIRSEFQRFGLESGPRDGSYLQPFEIVTDTKVVEPKTSLLLHGPGGQALTLQLGKDFQPLAIGGAGKAKAEIVFAGYGISAPKLKYDDYAAADVAGKVLLVIRREPQQGDDKSPFDGKKTSSHAYIRTKLQQAKKHKASAILLVNDPFTTRSEKKDSLTSPGGFGSRTMGVPFVHVSQATVNRVLETSPVKSPGGETIATVEALEKQIDDNLQPLTQPLEGWTAELQFTFEKVKTEVANVIGVLPGEGPLAEETVVLGAHYDHLGYGPFGSRRPNSREVHNGADDNASGTAAVMELARRFAEREKRSARRMVFIAFSAEERGIIGSNHYVANPLFPLEDTVAMFNFDMIGRMRKDGLQLGGVRSATEFASLVDKANGDQRLKVKTSGSVGASDHAGFYRKNIPVLFFFTGMTKEYHTPDDDFETINVEGVVRTIDFAEDLLDEVIDLPKRPHFVKVNRASRSSGSMAYLGVVPDYSGNSDGLRITDVNADSPAARGGLKPGDVIVQFGDIPVADIQGLADGLRKHKAGQKVKILVRRDKQDVAVEVTLGQPKGKR